MRAKLIRVDTTSKGVRVINGLKREPRQQFASMDQAMAAIQTKTNHGARVLVDGHPTFINAWIYS